MTQLKIQHFKCFEDAEIKLNRLTVMAGANGNGKSTAIQALLYLRYTIEHCGEALKDGYEIHKANGLNVPLNGVYCLALGNSFYVLNRNYNGNILSLGLFDTNKNITVDYGADVSEGEPRLYLTPIKIHKTEHTDFPILMHEFYYLNAERIGPRIIQSLRFNDFPNAGWQGENSAQLVNLDNGRFKVEHERHYKIETPEHKSGKKKITESPLIPDQVNAWLDFIMPGVLVKATTDSKTLVSQVLIENQFTVSDPTLSTNLGFGISYVLPIIATGLIAKKGSYFIVENPEAHLHPSAQSKIGRFLAMVANAGVNVIVETHSDHIINGIQIAVAEKEIENNLVTINFFSQTEGNNQPDITPINIKEKGELTEWPKGFFDQTQIEEGMRNFYLFEDALQVNSIPALELGINNLNSILVDRNADKDYFFCNPTIWECDTTQGIIYEMFGGIVNEELQRLIPFVFQSFISQNNVYQNHTQLDADFPVDCNAFIGFEFAHTTIPNDRKVFNPITYNDFVSKCLKYGTIANTNEMRENLLALFPSFIFEDRAVEETLDWKNKNQGLYDRLFDLFNDIPTNPFTGGIGETEVLKHMNGVASKRINQAHRVTYKLSGNETRILACNGHYD